jgi:hypothetical protein
VRELKRRSCGHYERATNAMILPIANALPMQSATGFSTRSGIDFWNPNPSNASWFAALTGCATRKTANARCAHDRANDYLRLRVECRDVTGSSLAKPFCGSRSC